MFCNSERLFEFQTALDETDIKKMKEVVKFMPLASHSQGFLLKMKGVLSKDPQEKTRLLYLSMDRFKRALSVNPDNRVTLRNLADVLGILDQNDYAKHVLEQTIKLDPRDTNSLFKYGGYFLWILNSYFTFF
jgi:hypothetical protein